MNNQDLIRILKKVPEKRLALLELVPKVLDSEGKVDTNLCLPMSEEIDKAVEEVRAYINDTENIKCALKRLVEGH